MKKANFRHLWGRVQTSYWKTAKWTAIYMTPLIVAVSLIAYFIPVLEEEGFYRRRNVEPGCYFDPDPALLPEVCCTGFPGADVLSGVIEFSINFVAAPVYFVALTPGFFLYYPAHCWDQYCFGYALYFSARHFLSVFLWLMTVTFYARLLFRLASRFYRFIRQKVVCVKAGRSAARPPKHTPTSDSL